MTKVETKTKIKNAAAHEAAVVGEKRETATSAVSESLLQALKHQIEQVPTAALTPYKGNARTHSKRQVGQIADSIKEFGFNAPILADEAGTIIAGHGRLEAAKKLGMATVPVVRLSHLTPEQKRAYIIADNRLAEKAGWDQEILAAEFKALVELDFNVDLTGFQLGEIDLVVDKAEDPKRDPASPEDQIPDVAPGVPVSRPGDLWQLGKHRLICGNALDDKVYEQLLQGELAQFVFGDPPFNVAIDGHASRQERDDDREFAMAGGEMTEDEFTAFLTDVFKNLVAHSANGSLHDICIDWRHLAEMTAAGRAAYSSLTNVCVWAKANAGMGAFYRSRHELVFIWKNGTGAHINNLEFNENGRVRSNVWDYAGCSTMQAGRREEIAMHPTTKPVALVADAIKDCSHRNGVVLDPFGGSGTTLIAAERTGRRGRAIEIEPRYVDVAIRRWQAYTGKSATLVGTGQGFEEVEAERRGTAQLGDMQSPDEGSGTATLDIAIASPAAPDLFGLGQATEVH